ncbi:hypothetical protein EBR96_04555 [bacterium]|nr:hypothetical protein [bacterium]
MIWSDIIGLIQSGDSLTAKFIKKSDDLGFIGSVMAAFANTIGGTIVLGIDRVNLHCIGSNLSEDELYAISNEIRPYVRCTVHTIAKGDRIIHVIDVPMGVNKPYLLHNVLYSLDESRPWTFKIQEQGVESASVSDSIEVEQPRYRDSVSEAGLIDAVTEEISVVMSSIAADSKPQATPQGVQLEFKATEFLNSRQQKALDYLGTQAVIQNKKYRELFHVSHKTAHIELTDLVNKGALSQRGMGRSTHYILKG